MNLRSMLIFPVCMLLCMLRAVPASAESVIIANDDRILTIFREKDPRAVEALARDVSSLYEGAVLHLGRAWVFRRGSPFFYRTSKANLQLFCKSMRASNSKVYLWFMDSFGSESFLQLYEEHEEIIDENLGIFDDLGLEYDGIVVDLEWINLSSGDNGGRYLRLLEYLHGKSRGKNLCVFAPIIDDPHENKRRGYDEEKILVYADIIPMLYIKDGGFHYRDGRVLPRINDSRIESLRRYHVYNGYTPAVSFEGGILIDRDDALHFVRTMGEAADAFPALKKTASHEGCYYRIDSYTAHEPFDLIKNDGTRELIGEYETIHHFRVLDSIVFPGDYIWEYFLLEHGVF